MKYPDKVCINPFNFSGLSLVKLNTLSIDQMTHLVSYVIQINMKQHAGQINPFTSNTATFENLMSFAQVGVAFSGDVNCGND